MSELLTYASLFKKSLEKGLEVWTML